MFDSPKYCTVYKLSIFIFSRTFTKVRLIWFKRFGCKPPAVSSNRTFCIVAFSYVQCPLSFKFKITFQLNQTRLFHEQNQKASLQIQELLVGLVQLVIAQYGHRGCTTLHHPLRIQDHET